jgi:hypothetical protein
LKIATTTSERNQKHKENYDEHKLRLVVGDHGAPGHSHLRFKYRLRLLIIVDGVSHSNKCILYMSKNIRCNILVVR